MNGLSLCLLLWMPLMQSTLNPALTPDLPALQDAWKQGYAYAQHHKDFYRPLKQARHGIGKIDRQWVSWVTFMHPRLVAYATGFEANKRQVSSNSPIDSFSALSNIVQEETKHLRFHVELGLYPVGAFTGAGFSRLANPSDLQGVQVQLQVGARIYNSLYQPEAIAPEAYKAYNAAGFQYKWYRGQFDVTFALFNPDGTPRITANDNEITVLVSGGFGQQSAKFNLKEWLNAYEK